MAPSKLTLSGLAEAVLPFRTADYITNLVDKLGSEGVVEPKDLLGTSRESLEIKLATHAAFKQSEVADTISLRAQVAKDTGLEDSRSSGRGQSPAARGRQRSNDPKQRCRSRSPPKVFHRGSGTRAPRSGSNGRGSRPQPNKPQLWAAVEIGDEAGVRRMLEEEGKDLEEKFQGWSPLMKAAEEGHVEICKLLLDKGADIEVQNSKGRTALSFAAAPSMKRPTATECLKLLLERGADTSHKDEQQRTAKQRASREKRDDAIAVFDEFERS